MAHEQFNHMTDWQATPKSPAELPVDSAMDPDSPDGGNASLDLVPVIITSQGRRVTPYRRL